MDPRRFWGNRYAEADWAYCCEPNDFFREQAQQLQTGEALCLAEGQGRNAAHLATLGHRVTAQELSPVGLNRADQLAQERGVAIHCLCCDLNDLQPEPESTDLVVAIWMHLPPDLRARVHADAVRALRPGGHLILEAYTPRQLAFGTGGPPSEELLIEPAVLRQELAGLELLVLEERERWIEEGLITEATAPWCRRWAANPAEKAGGQPIHLYRSGWRRCATDGQQNSDNLVDCSGRSPPSIAISGPAPRGTTPCHLGCMRISS
jgi:SAM-dependent methyltransferase